MDTCFNNSTINLLYAGCSMRKLQCYSRIQQEGEDSHCFLGSSPVSDQAGAEISQKHLRTIKF